MNPQNAIIDLVKLVRRAFGLSFSFEARKFDSRAFWMIIQVMVDFDYSRKDIADLIGKRPATVHYYQNQYKPYPGETELLEKLKGEF